MTIALSKDFHFENSALSRHPHDDLNHSLHLCCQNLFQQQHNDGYWWYTLEANDSINAEFIFLLHYLKLEDQNTERGICRWIVKNQNQDGSWSLFAGAPGDISATVECYFALKLCGYDIHSDIMLKAKSFILSCGGITQIRVFSRLHLALFGLVPWETCPQMPVAFIQLPEWSPVNIYEFSSWARACIVPLLVIMDLKKTCAIDLNLDELYVEPPHKAKWNFDQKNNGLLSLENAFIQLDKALQMAERLKLKPLRKSSLKKCEKYIRDHLSETEDIYPALFYGILALYSLGYSLSNDSHIQKALQGLKSFQITLKPDATTVDELPFDQDADPALPVTVTDESLVYQQCCISPVWDTAWATVALCDAGAHPSDPRLLKAARWLMEKQITDVKGDWVVKNPQGTAGGWSFEFQNKYYPDVDDTIEVLTFLHNVDLPFREVRQPFELGLNWLLSMQCSNGGFAAFDKDNDLRVLNKIPFSDHGACLDPPTADISGRVIEFLLRTCSFDKKSKVVQRAADFIVKQQQKDGSFWGRWGVNYIYGTWGALGGLCTLKRPEDAKVIARALTWLKSIQNADGGFGESCLSYVKQTYVPLPQEKSTASQTAWALMTLVSAGEAASVAAARAATYLIATQLPTGGWREDEFTGTGFPGHFYIRYHGYKHYFPAMALGRYEAKIKAL